MVFETTQNIYLTMGIYSLKTFLLESLVNHR